MKRKGMTKTDAAVLEALCEKRIAEAICETDVTVSMALNGRLKIEVSGNMFNFDMPDKKLDYFNFCGEYGGFLNTVERITKAIDDDFELFNLLMWSYENRGKLV